MTYFVLSDIHGDADCLKTALGCWDKENAAYQDKHQQDVNAPKELPILCLGDLLYHGPRNSIPAGYAPKECASILNEYGRLFTVIRGNCDADVDQMMLTFPIMAEYMILPLAGQGGLVVTHGHHDPASYFLKAEDVLLTGHTHVLKAVKKPLDQGGYTYLNPGSISLPKEENPRTYAMLEGRTFTVKTMDGGTLLSYDF